MPKPKVVKTMVPREVAERAFEHAKKNPDTHIIVNQYTMSHAEHREALSEEMSEKFKMKKRSAREFIDGVAEDVGLK